jgi:hypothetical protein
LKPGHHEQIRDFTAEILLQSKKWCSPIEPTDPGMDIDGRAIAECAKING